MGRDQNININTSLEEVIPTLMDDFEGFRTSVEEGTADVVEEARELESEVEPEDVTELLQSHDKNFMDEGWFLERRPDPRPPGKIVAAPHTGLERVLCPH